MRSILFAAALLFSTAALHAQSWEQRMEHLRQQQRAQGAAGNPTAGEPQLNIRQRMNGLVPNVNLQDMPAREALAWWSQATGVPLVVNWNAMELEGVRPETTLNVQLQLVPAGQLLQLLLRMTAPDIQMMYEVTPWYVQVMTKEQANQNTVVRVYDIGDLLVHVPSFTAPEFDLESAMESSSSRGGRGGGSAGSRGGGGSGGSGGRGLFSNRTEQQREDAPTRNERAEQIAQAIRDTIEPDTWETVGGRSSIRYFQGKLVVNAPMYVHRQIGLPVRTPNLDDDGPAPAPAASNRRIPTPTRQPMPTPVKVPGKPAEVSGVLPN